MTEIENLYKNAGIEAKAKSKELRECLIECSLVYPPFTTEKQLELYRWLLKNENVDYLCYWYNEIKEVWIFRVYLLTELSSENPIIYEGINKEFDEALANLINDYWNDLTEQEQQQIKEILK